MMVQNNGFRVTVHLYGIANCDTMKKARAWLDAAGLRYVFHDYKKEGVDPVRLAQWADDAGWEALLNTRGTTFRGLPESQRSNLDRARALALMEAHPSLIKRPVGEHMGGILVGFDAARWTQALT